MTTVAIAGASGFLGSAFARHLTGQGHEVRRIGRRSSRGVDFHWDLAAGTLDPAALDGADAVINFAGATVAQRWTQEHKTAILASRVRSTDLLARTMAAVRSPPRVFLAISAIGIYGSRGDEILDEASAPGRGSWPMSFGSGRAPPRPPVTRACASFIRAWGSFCIPMAACSRSFSRCSTSAVVERSEVARSG